MSAAACRWSWPSWAMSRSSSCRRFGRRSIRAGRSSRPACGSRCRSAARRWPARSCAARCRASKVPVYLVHQPQYYDRPELYRENGHDYKDNCERFVFFCRAALEAITLLDLGTELVHCHDWTTGLIPAYLKTELCGVPPYDSIRQRADDSQHRLPGQLLALGHGAHGHRLEVLQLAADGVLRQPQLPEERAGVRRRAHAPSARATRRRFSSRRWAAAWKASCSTAATTCSASSTASTTTSGIRRSIRTWAATTTASKNFAEGKRACKAALQQEVGLPQVADQPLVAMIGRLADQKGFDLVAKLIPQWAPTVERAVGDPRHGRAAVSRAVHRAGAAVSGQGRRAARVSRTSWPIASKPAPTCS